MSEPIVLVIQNLGVDEDTVRTVLSKAADGYGKVMFSTIADLSQEQKAAVTVLVHVKEVITSEIIHSLPSLKAIAVAFTGYNTVDLVPCRERNIKVYNVPAYSTNSVAELVIGLTLSLLRDIHVGNTLIRHGGWDIGHPGTELFGKTVAIIGTGAIGVRVAELFKVFGCKLIGWSRSENPQFIQLGGSYNNNLDQIFAQADIVTLHVPANANTNGMIGASLLDKLQPHACLINTARGTIVDQQALADALQAKKFRAGIDVFAIEPTTPGEDILLVDHSSVLTPHVAYKTKEALQRRLAITADNIKAFFNGSDVNRVDNIA